MITVMSVVDMVDAAPSNGKKGRKESTIVGRVLSKARGLKRVTSSISGPAKSPIESFQKLKADYAPLGYQLPWETLDYVELLATYNPDYSQAVENNKMLSNTGHTLMVDASSELQRRRTKEVLEEKARLIQPNAGGMDGVIEKLLDQGSTYGAMAGEWVLNDQLTDVIDFVDINPKTIRFFWDHTLQRWAPYQKVKPDQAKEAKEAGQEVINDCVRLNEITFVYHAFDSEPNSPYGVPPFLAALQNIAIQRDIVFNMAQIVKKIGLLAVVDMSIEKFPKAPGESDEEYEARLMDYLSSHVDAAEDMAENGGIVHFNDSEIKTTQIGGNAAGATNIHKANEEMVFSGLKSMPSVQGRSYSTTETYAGVAYEIIIRNTRKYQQAVKRFIERGYWLMAQLNGLNPDKIKLQFKENRSLNRLQEAQAHKVEISNAFMKWLLGIIDQMGVAQELGYAQPKTELPEPPEALIGIASAHSVDVVDKGDSELSTPTTARIEDADDDESELAQS